MPLDPPAPRRLHSGWRLGLFLLILSLLVALVAGLFFLVHFPQQLRHGILQPFPLLGTGVAAVAVALGASLIMLRSVERRTLATIGLPGGRARSAGIGAGLLLGGLVPLLVWTVFRLAGSATVVSVPLGLADLARATLPMAAATLLLSSWEEIAFRGYALQLLAEMGGPWPATVVTGVLFGLAHSGNPGANLLGFAFTAVNGVLLGWIVVRSGSLWLACGYHAGWNLTASLLLGLRDSGIVAPGSLYATTLAGPAWWSGGAYGFEASALTGVAETVVLLLILRNAARLPQVAAARPYYLGSSRAE